MKCKNCGAEVTEGAHRCEYCDSEVVRKGAVVTASAVEEGSPGEQAGDSVVGRSPGRPTSRADIFEAIKQSPAYTRRGSSQRHDRLSGGAGLTLLAPIIFFAIFITISLVIASGVIGMAGIAGSQFGAFGMLPGFMAIVPIGFVVLGVFMVIRSVAQYKQYRAAPVQGRAAIITSKRTAVSSGSRNHSATTLYYVTAEYEDGARREFAIMGHSLYGQVAEEDAGVIYTRANYALDFDRVLSV